MNGPIILCHGGAGHQASDQPGVDAAVEAGWAILTAGGSALEAALAAVVVMEDDPRLNAGNGGQIRSDGSVQLDAAIATSDGRLGMLMAIEHTANPILVAADLLEEQFHILVGRGAREYADDKGHPKTDVIGSDRPGASDTVGAVVRDSQGRLAVASSTGGCSGRPAGRVGDTPMWGVGLWCDTDIAIAATGIGEAIISEMLCHCVAIEHAKDGDMVRAIHWGIDRFSASTEVGLIGLGPNGSCAAANTGMPWAQRSSN